MKKLSMVVHQSLQQSLADYLRSQQFEIFMFTHVEEHSSQLQNDTFLSARDKVVGYVPQVRVDVIINEADIKPLLTSIQNSKYAFSGRGVYWVSELDEFGEL